MKKWIAAGATLLIVVMLVLLWPAGQKAGQPSPRPVSPAQPVPPQPSQPGQQGATPYASVPWANTAPGAAQNQGAPAARGAEAARARQLSELEAMQATLSQQLQQGKQPDPKQVDATLAKIQEISGSPTVAGVNLDAVRGNLAKAQQIQQLAEEIEREANKPGGPDINKIRSHLAQLQKLQGQMSTDVLAKPVAEPKK